MTATATDLDTLCINTIRALSMDAVQKANSGHPGAPMGLAPAAFVLFTRFLKHNPANPDWLDRDRFVLSGGHASMLLYSLLYLTGYGLTLDDLQNFRQWGSRTPGHPEFGHTPGVETTTGPLGQGFANAVGMAMAERHLAARFNRPGHDIVDHHTYVMCGDGDLMEGISAEAASLAGHLGLGRLICIYDDNGITIEGPTSIAFTEDVAKRFDAYGWQTIRVADGNDTAAIAEAIDVAKSEAGRPSLILLKTQIAYGSPNKQGSADAHGAPLGEAEVALTKECLRFPGNITFYIPEGVMEIFSACQSSGQAAEQTWMARFKAYHAAHPELAGAWADATSGFLSEGWADDIPSFTPADGPMATRAASGKVLNAIAQRLPTLMGGSADLAPSNKTYLSCSHEFQKAAYDGRNIRFGVREHAMASIMSGLFLHNGVRPFGGTFLVFADYMRPAIRVASLMKLPVIYVFTHDSVAVGEDGPTHQPVEHLASLRIIPGLTVFRPADATETADAWKAAITTFDGPVALVLSRQKLPVLDRPDKKEGVSMGAYVLRAGGDRPEIIFIATGSEVHLAISAAEVLAKDGVSARVVSMPSRERFEKTSPSYRDSILPPDVTTRLVIEAGQPMGWEKYAGARGDIMGISTFGASAPGPVVLEKFGFTVDAVVARAKKLLEKNGTSRQISA